MTSQRFLDADAVVDGVRISYRDRGRGPAVVLLHGTPAHSYEWRNIAPALEDHGYRVFTYDLLGYGASERPVDRDTSVDAQATLLGRIVEQFALDRPNLVGHDIGGAIAQVTAADDPASVAAVVLIDSVSYDSWPSATWRAIISDHLDSYSTMPQQEFEAMLRRQLTMTVADPARMRGTTLDAYLAPHRTALGRASFFEHQVRHYDSTCTQRVAQRLRELTMPTLVIWGEDDKWQPLTYARRLASDIPDAGLVTIPGAGHFVTEDAPEQTAHELITFLDEAQEHTPGATASTGSG